MAKQITKTVTEFETTDGKVFTTKEKAEQHETTLLELQAEKDANNEVREYVSKLLITIQKLNPGGKFSELNDLETALEEFIEIVDNNNDESDYESSDDYYDSGCSW